MQLYFGVRLWLAFYFLSSINEAKQTVKGLHQLEALVNACVGRLHQWKENVSLKLFSGCHCQGRICILGLELTFWFLDSCSRKDHCHPHLFSYVSSICLGG